MPKQLNVRSDIAYETAHALAHQARRSVAEIVETALIEMRDRTRIREDILAPAEVERRYRELQALVKRTAESRLPGSVADHDDLYDENGLPV